MGEAKQKRDRMSPQERLAVDLSRELANKGCLIEAGWVSLKAIWLPPDAPPAQVDDMRLAFMAGAQHLFSSIMGTMDPEAEVTEGDMKRMDLINAELGRVADELKLRFDRPKGSA